MKKKTVHLFFMILICGIFFESNINRLIHMTYIKLTSFFYNYIHVFKNKNKIYKMVFEFNRVKKMHAENIFLKKEIDFYKQFINNSNTFTKNLLLAEVISFVNTKKEKFIIINKGKEDKLELDMVVISPENIILGKITDLYDYFSIVKLLDNDDQFIAGMIDKKVEMMLQGCRSVEDGKMTIVTLSNKYNIGLSDNMVVYTSGKGLVYPAGYLIGTLEIGDKNKVNTPQIKIRNSYDIEKLQYCWIIMPKNHKKNIEFILKYKDMMSIKYL